MVTIRIHLIRIGRNEGAWVNALQCFQSFQQGKAEGRPFRLSRSKENNSCSFEDGSHEGVYIMAVVSRRADFFYIVRLPTLSTPFFRLHFATMISLDAAIPYSPPVYDWSLPGKRTVPTLSRLAAYSSGDGKGVDSRDFRPLRSRRVVRFRV